MDSITEILKAIETTQLDYISKEGTNFIVDRSFIEAWIEGNGEKEYVAYTVAYMDLLSRLKENSLVIPKIFIPVDVLIEMENDGKKYVNNKDFIDAINTFMIIKTVDPKKSLKGDEAVYEMAKQFEKYKYKNMVILTLNKSKYTPTSFILPLTVKEMFFTILIVYNLFSFELRGILREVYNNWLSDLNS